MRRDGDVVPHEAGLGVEGEPSMRFRLHARALLGGALLVACNAVLDNEPGILDEPTSNGTEPLPDAASHDAGTLPPSGSATATVDAGHDASNDLSPTAPPEVPAPVCAPGFADCNESASDGCESDVVSSITSCGACGVICPLKGLPHTLPACVLGACERMCEPGFADCNRKAKDGCEARLAKDKRNCGECGRFCLFGKCVEGECVW